MADERQDEHPERPTELEAMFKFIDEVHNCLALWPDISSPGYKDTKNKQKKMEEQIDMCWDLTRV